MKISEISGEADILFMVIETLYNAAGEQISSDSFEEYPTEQEANAAVERNFREMGHPDPNGNFAKWHVEAVKNR